MDDWYKDFDDDLWLKADDMPDEQARFIKRALRLRKGRRVLDVPCGAGRTSLGLAKLGVQVTGVDLRVKFVNRARRRFRKEGLSGTFLVGDMRELNYDGEFHAVVNWYGSFGYFGEAENLDVLRRFARALRPAGRLMIDQANRENVLRHFESEQRAQIPLRGRRGSGTFVARNRWNPCLQQVEGVWTLARSGRTVRCPLRIRLYAPRQFRELFARVGLAFEAIYGSWTGDPYSRTSRRLIVVARKMA